ncbi:DNA-3-methyladenine glycosylase I [Neisseriaceae bacterium ESL0693]|nr:DNA-3-methyladenine glycosylase I [Neisseriaceae bacterium ESL0693]
MSYCEVASLSADLQDPDRIYHDTEYGFPVTDDRELFERLMLEINQAGLNWRTILKKRAGLQAAYAGFEPARVALFDEQDIQRLMHDARVIRHQQKIRAAIYNARQVLELQERHGSLRQWLDDLYPLSLDQWVKCFKQQFKFVGRETVQSFLLSTGYLEGAHEPDCSVYALILAHNPPWHRH